MGSLRMWVVLGIALIAACGSDKTPPPPPDPNGIEVVYAGAEPRQVLRYQIAKGDTVELELAMDVELDAGGRGGPLPTVIVATRLVAQDVRADGTAEVRATITAVRAREVPNSAVSADSIATHMQPLAGTVLTATLSPDGGLRDVHAEPSTKLPPALAQQLETVARSFQQIAMPLPHLAIGAGAAWRARRTIEQNGMRLYVVTTIVVTAVDARGFTFTSSSSVGGPDQKVTLAGQTIEMTSIGGTGAGKGTIDLTKMVMTGDATLAFHSDMTAGGETDAMAMAVAIQVSPAARETATASAAAGSANAGSANAGSANAGSANALGDDEEPPEDLAAPDNTEASGENRPVAP